MKATHIILLLCVIIMAWFISARIVVIVQTGKDRVGKEKNLSYSDTKRNKDITCQLAAKKPVK